MKTLLKVLMILAGGFVLGNIAVFLHDGVGGAVIANAREVGR